MKLKLSKLLLVATFICMNSVVMAQDYKYHPSYIYNFTKYIQWPANYQSGDFVIGVLGNSGIIAELEKMAATKSVGSQNFVIKKYSNISEVEKCQMLFIPSNKSKELASALEKLSGQSTLVLTEKPGLGVEGSGINFILDNGRWKFELNEAAAAKNKLKVSSELTRFAILI